MKHVFSNGHKLIAGLLLMIMAGTSLAATTGASYTKPGLDLSKYNKVMVMPLNIDNIEVLKPVWESDDPEAWSFEGGAGAEVKELFMDAMQKELEANGGYPMVSTSSEDALRIEVEVLSITPYVKPGTGAHDGEFVTSTLGSGDLVISAEFRDSKTRELLILVEGERTIGTEYKKLSRENHKENLTELFTLWGVKVREALNKGRE